jgi:hypothetical protein
MMARYYSSSLGRFMAVDPGDDTDATKPQSWNKYAYVRNNPISFLDATGLEIIYASTKQQEMLTQARQQSPTLNAALSAFDGKGAPNLRFQYGDAGKDANGKDDATGKTVNDISPGYDPAKVDSEADLVDANLSSETTTFEGATITIDDSVKGTGAEVGVTFHEVGHADDARKDPVQNLRDTHKTEATKGATPHDKRPEEKRANDFRDKVKKEIDTNKTKK